MSIIYFRNSPNEAWATIPAIKGEKGETPIKGIDYFTEEEIEAIKADIQAPEVDLSNYYTKEETNTVISSGTVGLATTSYVDNKISNIEFPTTDLSNYYTKSEVDEKIDNIVVGEDVEVNLSNYYTKSEVDTLIEGIEIPEVDLTAYAKKTDIPSLDGYAKTADIPDTSSFITIGDVEGKGYQTEEQVAAAINEALGVVENGTY